MKYQVTRIIHETGIRPDVTTEQLGRLVVQSMRMTIIDKYICLMMGLNVQSSS